MRSEQVCSVESYVNAQKFTIKYAFLDRSSGDVLHDLPPRCQI